MQLEGMSAVITGAGSGIGRAVAIEAVARGMRVAVVGRRTQALEETRALVRADACVVCPGDITEPAQRARLGERIAAAFGSVGLLVNNAGVVHTGTLDSCQDDDIERMVATNLVAPIAFTRTLLPLLRKAPHARVLNVGSMFGDIAFPYFATYSATKFALRGFSDALRRELVPDGIGVTYAAPRAVRTPAAEGFAHLVGPMKMKLDAPQDVARSLLDAVARDARSVYPRGAERMFVLLQRLFPALIDGNLGKMAGEGAVREAVRAGSV